MAERKAPHDPHRVVAEFAEILKAYKVFAVTGDRYGGSWPETAYREQGVSYEQAAMTASELYLAALPLFSASSIELPRSDRLRGQLCSLLRKTSSGGRDQVIAGQSDNTHADLANAVVGAIMGAAASCCSIGYVAFCGEDDEDDAPSNGRRLYNVSDLQRVISGGSF